MQHHLNSKIAVVDLGTNTFHTVIFERKDSIVSEVFRKRHHVFLSEQGIQTICASAIERARKAITDFTQLIAEHQVEKVFAIGTEGLRKASNGPELSNFIESSLGVPVELISGKREAELIAKGVLWQFNASIDNALIMDIGGGSVEFIHLKNNRIKWLQSFPIGVGVLFNKFTHQEPVQQNEIDEIRTHLADKASELIEYIKDKSINTLIGASGSFELIPAIIEGKYPPTIEKSEILLDEFQLIHDRIIRSDLDARLSINGLPPVRAKLIVVAFILMEWMINSLSSEKLLISKYAVKEGLAAEKLDIINF